MALVSLLRRASSISTASAARLPQRFTVSPSFAVRAMSSAADDKKFFVLRYEYVPDILEKRGPFRAEHLQNALNLKAEGKILMGGALVEPADAALIIFSTNDKQEIEHFVKNDPYVKNKLVTSYSIREWMVVI